MQGNPNLQGLYLDVLHIQDFGFRQGRDSHPAPLAFFGKKVEPVHISGLEYLAVHGTNDQKSLQIQGKLSEKNKPCFFAGQKKAQISNLDFKADSFGIPRNCQNHL